MLVGSCDTRGSARLFRIVPMHALRIAPGISQDHGRSAQMHAPIGCNRTQKKGRPLSRRAAFQDFCSQPLFSARAPTPLSMGEASEARPGTLAHSRNSAVRQRSFTANAPLPLTPTYPSPDGRGAQARYVGPQPNSSPASGRGLKRAHVAYPETYGCSCGSPAPSTASCRRSSAATTAWRRAPPIIAVSQSCSRSAHARFASGCDNS